MKNLLTIVICFFVITGCISCKKNADMSSAVSESLQNNLIAGYWKVAYLNTDSTDKTAQYTDYTLTFNSNGFSTVANPLLSLNGSWAVSEGSAVGNQVLHLAYTHAELNPPFLVFPGDWIVTAHTADEVALQRSSVGTDRLTIQRIK